MAINREIGNVVIRNLTEKDNDVIQAIKNDTGCGSASKALMQCAYSYVRISDTMKRQTARIRELELENHRLRTNAALIAEVVKKNDLVLSKTQGQKSE